MYKFISVLSLLISMNSLATQIYDTLYINKDTVTIGLQNMQLCVFNDSSDFKPFNHFFEILNDDTLQIHVINNDSLPHSFTVDGVIDEPILAFGSADIELALDPEMAYRYYSNDSNGDLLGASGIIMKGYSNYEKFYWNMFEQSSQLSFDLAALTQTSVPTTYIPDVFTINQKVFPQTQMDTLGKVNAFVNDTLIITTVNSGKMEHTLHFHGFHVEILQVTHNTKMLGWEKDTYPLEIDEIIVVRLIPHQAGTYPVHEHNLLNVTTSGSYPGGMIEILTISP